MFRKWLNCFLLRESSLGTGRQVPYLPLMYKYLICAQDMLGNTALHLAACTNHVPVVTLLLRYHNTISLRWQCTYPVFRIRIRLDPDSNCQTGSGSVFGIRILKVKLSYKNPLFSQIFNDFHLLLKIIPNKSSLFNKIPT